MEILNFIENYILGFFILISILVFIHELGHYFFAKLFKVKVESFSIGFGKEIFGWTDKSGTRWKLALLPLGGYVKMKGEMISDNNTVGDSDSFQSKYLWQKALIVFGGPLFNFIFPIIVLIFITFFSGVPNLIPKIDKILENSPADKILQNSDIILAVNNINIESFSELSDILSQLPNKNITLKVQRSNKIIHIDLKVGSKEYNNKQIGYLGIMADQNSVYFTKYSILDSIQNAYKIYSKVFYLIAEGLLRLITGNVSKDDFGGPLKIAQLSGDSLKQGLNSWLFFMAMLSINLAVINLFPIPALDGGHLLIYLVQFIIRRPINLKIQNFLMQIGFFFLMALMILIILKDFVSFFFEYIK